jgi:hypothetical protein
MHLFGATPPSFCHFKINIFHCAFEYILMFTYILTIMNLDYQNDIFILMFNSFDAILSSQVSMLCIFLFLFIYYVI